MKIFPYVLFLFFAGFLAAQQKASTASLQGVVVKEGTETALSGVTVQLLERDGTDSGLPLVITDSVGIFIFPKIPAGVYRVEASRPGYVRGEYGVRRWGDS